MSIADAVEDERRALRKTIKRDAFSPIEDDSVERRNVRTQFIIERDGSLRERVSLQVPSPAHREQLICLHYLRHYARCFLDEPLGVDVLGRDAPWDFDLALSTGDRFFVEITAIADSRLQFERDKREERMLLMSRRPTIRVRDLRKLARMFATTAGDAALALHAATPANLEVDNPFHHDGQNLTLGSVVRPTRSLADQIVEAVDRKAAKKHDGNDRTVLLLDYRGNFPDREELKAAAADLEAYFCECPFPEVWFYVGYFSGRPWQQC